MPFRKYDHCVTEKFAWVEQNLGRDWLRKLILTKDKTMVRGDVLIDDKLQTGSQKSEWQQIFFDRSYNRDLPGPRISNWSDWSQVLANVK